MLFILDRRARRRLLSRFKVTVLSRRTIILLISTTESKHNSTISIRASSAALVVVSLICCHAWRVHVYRIPRVLDCQQSLLIVSKARQERLRNGHATVTRRAKITGSQIGSALAPRWLRIGSRSFQTLGSNVQQLNSWFHTKSSCIMSSCSIRWQHHHSRIHQFDSTTKE